MSEQGFGNADSEVELLIGGESEVREEYRKESHLGLRSTSEYDAS